MADLKGIYFSMEDKWYSFVDTVSDKLPFFGKVVDGIEDKNIPSFPLAIALIVIIILALFFLLANQGAALTILVTDDNDVVLEGATVGIYLDTILVDERPTNSEGKVTFILSGTNYTIKIDKDGYALRTKENVSPGSETLVLSQEDVTLTKAISLKAASGQLVSGSGVVRYSCISTGEQKIGSYSGGIFTADFANCTEISLDAVAGYVIVNGTASFSGTNNIVLEEETTNTGTITATINATDDLAGVRVTIRGEDGTPTQVKTLSSGTAIAVFENVPTKKYYITVHDPEGNYQDYDGLALGEIKELRKDETLGYNLTLNKTTSSIIKVNIKDIDSALPIIGAEVKIATSNGSNVIDTEVTGASGQIEFNVPKDSEYIVSAQHNEYIVGQSQTASSGDTITFNLVKATESNSKTLIVKVIDPRNAPIRSVNVTVKRLDDTKIGEKVTGANGEVEFYNVEPASYYAYAIKNGFEGTTSTTIQVLPQRENVLTVIMDIGEGDIDLTVKDNSFALVSGASVKAIDYYTGTVEETKTTTEEGKVNFSIREDKKVYFVISKNEFLDYYTATINPDQGSTLVKEVVLGKSNEKVTARIIGIYNNEGEIGSERVIGAGNYIIKSVLEVPKGNFTESGMTIITGEITNDKINLMEGDLAKLGSVYSSADTTQKGTTYSPPNNYSTDLGNLTNGTAKWIEAKWKNPKEGLYEIETELIIQDVNPNTGINLWYKGYAKGGTTLRSTPNNNTGSELYASASNYLLVSGATNLCKESFCTSKSITTLSGTNTGRTQYISTKFNANKDNDYVYNATLVSRKSISNAVLGIDESGITIDSIKVNGLDAENEVSIGNISQDSVTNVEVKFRTTSSGTSNIKLKVNSSTATELEDNTIITVKANDKFKLDIAPKQIIPYMNNLIVVEASDGNTPLKDVLVEIKVNNNVITTLETNAEGLAQYELSEPSIGDSVIITATKEGYDTIVTTKDVDGRLLLITPPEISETIKIGETASIENLILVENATIAKLNITNITVSGELSDYLTVTISDATGQSINAGEDANYSLKIKPNSKAKLLQSPKTVTGKVEIITSINETNQTFSSEIPVSIRLSMPGYLDSDKCLHITPSNLEFIANSTEVTKTIEIENACTAEGINVNLFDIEAKLSEISKLGTIGISGVGFSNANISETYGKIADVLESQTKETLTVRFMPNSSVDTGTQKVNIMFSAKNVAEEDASEQIETQISSNITLSNLSKCVEIEEPTGGLTLNIASNNLGYNKVQSSTLSSNMQNYPGFANMSSIYNLLQNQSNAGPAPYEQNSFIIKNNCAADVMIDLDADSRLNVNDNEITISSGSDATIAVSSGYTLGKYTVKVNAKLDEEFAKKEKIGTVNVKVQKLGDIDRDCIKTDVSKITFNSFLYESKQYKVYNSCYNTGVMLNRTNTVTVSCDSPNRYTNQLNTLSTTQTAVNDCAMVAGTRTFSQRLINDTEEITFEVMPSANYLPQAKLFDDSQNTFGLFNNLADIRKWATETEGRTEVYGSLKVNYTNQYGSGQVMEFPITIEDNWRMLESVDAAINWGDPKAKPQECIGDRREKALNIMSFWMTRSSGKGIIPEAEYNSKGVYTYIAEPSAVQIGPAPTVGTLYPQTTFWSNDAQPKLGTKNCGLMDRLSNLKYDTDFGGVVLGVETLRKGSLVNNTLGPNLVVNLDRSNIKYDCVYINTKVTADLTRAINMESANVSWDLQAIVTKPGFKIEQGFDPVTKCFNVGSGELNCEALAKTYAKGEYNTFTDKYPDCAGKLSETRFNSLKDEVAAQGKCETNGNDYGFDKIKLLSAKELSTLPKAELDTYCNNNFCNNEMLQLYMLNKYQKIYNALQESNIQNLELKARTAFGDNPAKLEEIYKIAPSIHKSVCLNAHNDNNYYYSKVMNPITLPVKINDFATADELTAINVDDPALNNNNNRSPFVAMNSILKKMVEKDTQEEYFLEYTQGTSLNYISLEAYKKIIEKAESSGHMGSTDKDVNINCYPDITFTLEQIQGIVNSNSAKIVKLIKVGKDNYTPEEIKAIYAANSDLKAVNDNAEFAGLYLTAQSATNLDYKDPIFAGTGIDAEAKLYTVTLDGETGPGKYKVVLSGDFVKMSKVSATNPSSITIKLSNKEPVGKAADNILLKKGFNLTPNEAADAHKLASEGVIVDGSGIFYNRTPVLLTIDVPSNEKMIGYHADKGGITSQNNLITWNQGNKIINDAKNGSGYMVTLESSSVARSISGIYYYPEGIGLIIKTSNVDRIPVEAIGKVFNTTKTGHVSATTNGDDLTVLGLVMPTLSEILPKMNTEVCITTDGSQIIWNRAEIK
ncbi:MAG: carboxypeptidase-like regulatory domain-containing protein [archaeon]